MNPAINGSNKWRLLASLAAALLSGFAFALPMIESSSAAVKLQVYGFPLAYLKAHGVYPTATAFDAGTDPTAARQFFPQALVFDVVVGCLIIVVSWVFIFSRSRSWSTRTCATAATVFVGVGLLILSLRWLPFPLNLVVFLVLLIGIPIAWIYCLCCVSWIWSERLLGTNRGYVGPWLLACLLMGGGWWCQPQDIFSTRNRDVTPELVRYLAHPNPHLRTLAIRRLRHLGPYDDVTAQAILKALSDPDWNVRSTAESLLDDLGPIAADAVPMLIEQLQSHRKGLLAGDGLWGLASIGPPAKAAIPILKQELPLATGYRKLGICQALWSIEKRADSVVPAAIELLGDDFGPIQVDAAHLLKSIGPEAKAAVPKLVELVNHVPKPDQALPATGQAPSASQRDPKPPAPRSMTDAEFYPQIKEAAESALISIQ